MENVYLMDFLQIILDYYIPSHGADEMCLKNSDYNIENCIIFHSNLEWVYYWLMFINKSYSWTSVHN